MARLRRFERHRYIGTRHDMRVHDCDDPDQFDRLSRLVDDGDLATTMQLQAFAPDTLAEARNRGFRPF